MVDILYKFTLVSVTSNVTAKKNDCCWGQVSTFLSCSFAILNDVASTFGSGKVLKKSYCSVHRPFIFKIIQYLIYESWWDVSSKIAVAATAFDLCWAMINVLLSRPTTNSYYFVVGIKAPGSLMNVVIKPIVFQLKSRATTFFFAKLHCCRLLNGWLVNFNYSDCLLLLPRVHSWYLTLPLSFFNAVGVAPSWYHKCRLLYSD